MRQQPFLFISYGVVVLTLLLSKGAVQQTWNFPITLDVEDNSVYYHTYNFMINHLYVETNYVHQDNGRKTSSF